MNGKIDGKQGRIDFFLSFLSDGPSSFDIPYSNPVIFIKEMSRHLITSNDYIYIKASFKVF